MFYLSFPRITFEGAGGRRPQRKIKKKEKKKKEKKEKRKKKEKGKKINKRTMNNVKELDIKYCFFSIFQWH